MEVKYDYTSLEKKVDKIIKLSASYLVDLSHSYIENQVKKAYIYARDAHEWQMRLSWDPYIIHPVEATLILLDLKPDLVTIQACLLHDVVEDTPRTLQNIKDNFWEEVAKICEWMEKVSKVRYKWEERSISSLRKMFVAMSDDLRVIFVKLSDRLHNMRTLKYHPKKEKIERISLETLNIYAPIADRLWLHSLKNQLDEECFKMLNPYEYKNIKKQLLSSSNLISSFKKNAKIEIDNVLKNSWIQYLLDFRVKSIYSIYKKMNRKWFEDINDLYDIYWVKILVNNIEDCYKVLWVVHNEWTPLPHRFKDYIALPKPNWYKSLHTTVLWLLRSHRAQPTEVQIKTFEMDLESNIWVAAHFDYKENWSKISKDVNWVKELKELTQNLWNNDFLDSLKIDVFKDRIFVLTPKWDTINLPSWSTPIDFAYSIHTDLWNHITIAKVNWHVQPLDKELRNWDIVEVIIDKNKKPNPFSISYVKTAKAKNSIRAFMKEEDRELHKERWKEILNKLLEKAWFDKLDKDLTVLKNLDDRTFTVEERNDILEQVWNFSTNPSAIIKKIFKTKNLKYKQERSKWDKEKFSQEWEFENNEEIIIWWEKNIPYKIWSCCSENLWKKIVAYINSKWVITIHNRHCETISKYSKERLLNAYYEWQDLNNIIFDINFIILNKIWVLKDLSTILFDMNINTLEITSKRIEFDKTSLFLKLEIHDHDYLIIDRFLDRVKIRLWDNLLSFEIKKIES